MSKFKGKAPHKKLKPGQPKARPLTIKAITPGRIKQRPTDTLLATAYCLVALHDRAKDDEVKANLKTLIAFIYQELNERAGKVINGEQRNDGGSGTGISA